MKKPTVRVKKFDPTDFVIKVNTEMFITNRQDWIFGWFETKEQSLQMAEKHLEEFINLQARRCPTWHRVLAGMMVYYPLFKWRRRVINWFWTKILLPLLLVVSFLLRWSVSKLIKWSEENVDLATKVMYCAPKILLVMLSGCGLFSVWVALDLYSENIKTVVATSVIEVPKRVSNSTSDWYSDRMLRQTQAKLQEQLAIQKQKMWEQQNPTEVARLKAEQEQERLEELKREQKETERKWEGRMLDALDVFKGIGILILSCIGMALAMGVAVLVVWLLAETIKPLQRFLNAVSKIILICLVFIFIGFEKYTPTFYRWTDRFIVFVFTEFPALVRKGYSFVKYAWDWAWGRLCPALSVHGAKDMLEDVQAELAQLRAQKNPPQTSPVPVVAEEGE